MERKALDWIFRRTPKNHSHCPSTVCSFKCFETQLSYWLNFMSVLSFLGIFNPQQIQLNRFKLSRVEKKLSELLHILIPRLPMLSLFWNFFFQQNWIDLRSKAWHRKSAIFFYSGYVSRWLFAEVQIIIDHIESSKFMTQINLERPSKIKANHKCCVSPSIFHYWNAWLTTYLLDPMQGPLTFTNRICFTVAAISIRH